MNARKAPTQKAPIVFDPITARSLLGDLFDSVNGGAMWRNVGGPTEHVRQMRIVDDVINVATDGGLLACSDLCLPN